MHLTGNDPRRIIQEKGLGQISDEETIGKIIEEVIAENQKLLMNIDKAMKMCYNFW